MDANTQIANDLHLLTAPIRFLFRCVLALVFLLLAPLLYAAVPFALIAADPNSDFSILALAYLALGPFASAFWLMMVGVLPDVYRAHKECRAFEANHFNGFGLMFIGFFGSLGAEVLFLFYLFPIPRETSDIAANASNWRSWFAGMGIAGFLPVILLLGWRATKTASAGRQTCRWCGETVGTANLDSVGLCSPCHDAALEEKEIDEDQEAWIHKVKYELHDKAWASDLRRGRREALKWKRRVLRSC
ncbi:MAG: hypothetical protein WB952_01315 [Terriglobales bacterium]